jgi:transposase
MKKLKTGGAKVKRGLVKTRKHHTPEFKAMVLERCVREGVAVTAADLGLRESMLYAWRKAAQVASSVSESERMQNAELARLRREVAALQEENGFLKKAAAYFAKVSK